MTNRVCFLTQGHSSSPILSEEWLVRKVLAPLALSYSSSVQGTRGRGRAPFIKAFIVSPVLLLIPSSQSTVSRNDHRGTGAPTVH